MYNQDEPQDLRREPRVESSLPVRVSIGSQISVLGILKDISVKSAFITIKNNVFLAINDEVGITIQCSPQEIDDIIEGVARVSRIVPGEGLAIYFIKMDDNSLGKLRKMVKAGISFNGPQPSRY